jgi:hypothetical protein
MRRCVHIAVALLAVFLLVKPFDCFSGGKFDKKAADCCNKGKCSPSNPDDCCKTTLPGGNQLVTVQTTDHSVLVLDVVLADVPTTAFQLSTIALFVETHQPPGTPPDLSLNLPLLI